ncbi:hypothetical protein mru_1740 [Methanobrevibacter ruminantium M1]|uniref:Uncharacterized protein n=1 Tax=Methanobrevibacter ruminantium (strain ATCC 35063 / DSM 1093 / JCM 13430 / OCM 146 / M1) TaxID=634498 RepID=D3DZ40_METRM|nr:hypothetical protein mru_1740 [Methanobrevibacter ruminantium M1]
MGLILFFLSYFLLFLFSQIHHSFYDIIIIASPICHSKSQGIYLYMMMFKLLLKNKNRPIVEKLFRRILG